eukprot:COSAG06_NODE_13355_length_1265_cov_1.457118_2_plen_150_part_00
MLLRRTLITVTRSFMFDFILLDCVCVFLSLQRLPRPPRPHLRRRQGRRGGGDDAEGHGAALHRYVLRFRVLSLCLFRACLGKKNIFRYKSKWAAAMMLKKVVMRWRFTTGHDHKSRRAAEMEHPRGNVLQSYHVQSSLWEDSQRMGANF